VSIDSDNFDLSAPGWQQIAEQVWELRRPDGVVLRHASGFKGMLWIFDEAKARVLELEHFAAQHSSPLIDARLRHRRAEILAIAKALARISHQRVSPR
jgi:hypothetical protein